MPIKGSEIKVRRQKWERIISEQEKSQKSVREFCKSLDLKVSQFWYWRKKVKGPSKTLMVSPSGAGFVGVEPSGDPSGRLSRILFPQGMVVETIGLPDPLWVSQLIKHL